MDQLKCASLSHTHYWYDVGMLKVPTDDGETVIFAGGKDISVACPFLVSLNLQSCQVRETRQELSSKMRANAVCDPDG